MGSLPHVMVNQEYRLANAGFMFDFQLVNVEDFNGVGETEPNPYFYQVIWCLLLDVDKADCCNMLILGLNNAGLFLLAFLMQKGNIISPIEQKIPNPVQFLCLLWFSGIKLHQLPSQSCLQHYYLCLAVLCLE